jgi:hypothetical protein
MLTPKDLIDQKTFFQSKDANWYNYDGYGIIFEGHRTLFVSVCEGGAIEELKTLSSLNDLKETYELLTGEDFDQPWDDSDGSCEQCNMRYGEPHEACCPYYG